MEFEGFGEYAVDFFDGLAADNSKSYWTDHKPVYDRDIRAPMERLLAELESEFGAGKVFRPYRDVRFSKDKRPYKDHCGGVVEQGRGGGAWYVEVSAEGLMIGGGSFAMAPDQLARYRTAVDDDRRGTRLVGILAKLVKAGWEVCGEVMKTKPRGVDPEHPRLDLLRHRSIYVAKRWAPDDDLHGPECLERVRLGWRELNAINEWCADHVGLSEQWRR